MLMAVWLAEARPVFVENAPDLLPLFDTYAAEADFGRRYLDGDLARLASGSAILEVGAGSLLLSCQLVREGFEVTALEPIGVGFSHFDRMRTMILEKARSIGCAPAILALPGEALDRRESFDYAFSVNVMEHVENVGVVLANVTASLRPGASYRFTCPNYLFPYEPHFNIPTLFSKQLTETVLGGKIFGHRGMPDPAGTWRSLNWINTIQVRRIVGGLAGMKVTCSRNMLASTFERIATDPNFASRRSGFFRRVILTLVGLRVHRLLKFVPAFMQPIMDCRVDKLANGRAI